MLGLGGLANHFLLPGCHLSFLVLSSCTTRMAGRSFALPPREDLAPTDTTYYPSLYTI
jgi:hypothetical protein